MLAFIIYGWSTYKNHLAQGGFQCPTCCSQRACDVTQGSTWVTLYFIPVIPLGKSKPRLTCRGCQGDFDAPADLVHRHPTTNPLPLVLAAGALMFFGPVLVLVPLAMVVGALKGKDRPVAQRPVSDDPEEALRILRGDDARERAIERDMPELRKQGLIGLEIEYEDGTTKQFGDFPKELSGPNRPGAKHAPGVNPPGTNRSLAPPDTHRTSPPVAPRVEPPKIESAKVDAPKIDITPRIEPPRIETPTRPVRPPRPQLDTPAPEPNVWEVKADPPAEMLKLRANILPMTLGLGDDLIFPPAPSPFMAVKRLLPKQKLELWDWTKSRKVTEIKEFNDSSHHLSLSPDGTLAGVRAFVRSGTKEAIRQWTFKTGKSADLTWADALTGMPQSSLYLPQDRVLVVSGDHKSMIVLGTQGDEVWRTTVPNNQFEVVACASPGGRCLAYVVGEGERLMVVDLSTRQMVGNLAIPPARPHYIHLRTKGLSFSPDGSKLAGLFQEGIKPRLIVWDVSTGQPAIDQAYEGKHLDGIYRGQQIEWFDDGGLLLGGSLWVNPAGELQGVAPDRDPGERQPRRVADGHRLLMVKDKKLVVHTLTPGR